MIRVAVDVETSGFKTWWHDVITIGLAVYENESQAPIATFYDKCRPWMPANFNPESKIAHGFDLEDTLRWQEPRSMSVGILHFLKEFKPRIGYIPFLYHAQNNFDFFFVQNLFIKSELQFSFYKIFNEQHTISTLIEARYAGYQGNDLKSWAARLNMTFNHHNALDDALMCGAIYNYLRSSNGTLFKSEDKQDREFYRGRTGKVRASKSGAGKNNKLSDIQGKII